jgi:hypothetical protein
VCCFWPQVCIFAYGQTGSGKTYTMFGNDNNRGIIPRAMAQVSKHFMQHAASCFVPVPLCRLLLVMNVWTHTSAAAISSSCGLRYLLWWSAGSLKMTELFGVLLVLIMCCLAIGLLLPASGV